MFLCECTSYMCPQLRMVHSGGNDYDYESCMCKNVHESLGNAVLYSHIIITEVVKDKSSST